MFTNYTKRPRPVVRVLKNPSELQWKPEATPLFSVLNGENIRAGESFAVVRPGIERWPLGIVSDHYKVIDHNDTRKAILEGASHLVSPWGAIQAGHGYHVAQSFIVKHFESDEFKAAKVKSRLVVHHDHTGTGALRAVMVVYVDGFPMGAVVRARGLHVGQNPTIWAGEIDGMIEKAILAQDALMSLFSAAEQRKLNDTDREWLASKEIVSKKGKKAENLLEYMKCWFEGNFAKDKMTWGTWERRLDDKAIRTMCEFLGLAKFGTPLDEILGGKAYGKGQKMTEEAAAESAA